MNISLVIGYEQENVVKLEQALASKACMYSKNGLGFYKLNDTLYNIRKGIACVSEYPCKSKKEVLETLDVLHSFSSFIKEKRFYFLYINKYDVLIKLDYKDIKSFLSKSLKKFFKDVK